MRIMLVLTALMLAGCGSTATLLYGTSAVCPAQAPARICKSYDIPKTGAIDVHYEIKRARIVNELCSFNLDQFYNLYDKCVENHSEK